MTHDIHHAVTKKWELAWERPLSQWQEELQITPAA
jgi:ubiquinone biosynthesis protein Coq4